MKPLLEITPFLAVAVAAHVGVFALVAQGGGSAGGDDGKGQITLEGGDPGIAAMVATWERPPELLVTPEPAINAAPPADDETLPQPTVTAAPALPVLRPLTPLAIATDPAPDSTPPIPPVALMPPPDPTPDLPDLADTAGALPVPPVTETPALAGLFDQRELVRELTTASPAPRVPAAALPDT